MFLTQTVLSPIAITVRDLTLVVMHEMDANRVQLLCGEILEANTIDVALDSPEMKAAVASVVEGVHAAVAQSRSELLQMAMRAVARFASRREGTDPTVVASVICDAASVVEVSESERETYLESTIDAVLTACDHLLGPERQELTAFLHSSLTMFFEKGTSGNSDGSAHSEPGSS